MHERYPISKNLIGRLSFYRRMLERTLAETARQGFIYSHELASLSGYTPALVRRDIMTIGFSGNPQTGYRVADLLDSIGRFLDTPERPRVALAGVGNLGRALLAYFAAPRSKISIVAAFDSDTTLVGRDFQGCPCYNITDVDLVVRRETIRVAVLAVPPFAAQSTADLFVAAGVRGILNFAPVFLEAPEDLYVHNIDMTMSLEQVAYFAR